MRLNIRSALPGFLLATGACYAYRPVATAPRPESHVRIVLASASEVITVAREGTRRTIPGVIEVSGTMQGAAADTVSVRLGELRTATGVITDLADQNAMLPTALIARIEQREFQAGRTALTGIGLLALAGTGFLVAIIVVLTRAD